MGVFLLVVLAVLLLAFFFVVYPDFYQSKLGPRESVLFRPERHLITYTVFKPAILFVEDSVFLGEALVAFFGLSNLHTLSCKVVASTSVAPYTLFLNCF